MTLRPANMQIVASYRVKSGLPLNPRTEISIGHWTRFTEETMRARFSLGICSAALVAATSFARLAQGQVDRYDVLANSLLVETGRRRKRLGCSRTKLLFQRTTQTYLWALITRWACGE